MNSACLSYRSSNIHYVFFNTGNLPIFCFHGYGENCTAFSFFEKPEYNNYSFYALDLPFHGKTEWNDGLSISETDLQNIIDIILQKHNHVQGNFINYPILLGYSLGCRVALSLYQQHPERFSTLVLLAPDGLKMNWGYWFATQTQIGKGLFKFTMKYPGWFTKSVAFFNKMGFINTSVYRFINANLCIAEDRRLLYNRWITLRKIKPNITIIKSIITKNNSKLTLVYGIYDRIILSSVGEKFRTGIEENCKIILLPSGHQLLNEKFAKTIFAILQQ